MTAKRPITIVEKKGCIQRKSIKRKRTEKEGKSDNLHQ